MAAEAASASGARVAVYDAMPSVGRKFLLAGKGGLNLTHSASLDTFLDCYGAHSEPFARLLGAFGSEALRAWALELGFPTVIGSSGRVFPSDFKAAPMLRAWLHRLRQSGVRIHPRNRWIGWTPDGQLAFATADGSRTVDAQATILALGGGSWPKLGSDGAWVALLRDQRIAVETLRPANCGFDVGWSAYLRERYAGAPVKPVIVSFRNAMGVSEKRQGEFIITDSGVEGGIIYALSPLLREQIAANGSACIHLDLAPGRGEERIREALAQPRGSRSMSKHLKRCAGFEGVKAALLRDVLDDEVFSDAARLAAAVKSLPLRLVATRPLAEAISSAGGVRFEGLDAHLMLKTRPGTFCAGEMLDWEAPTGGFLLTGCFTTGRAAGNGAVVWLRKTYNAY
jgi:hypothetical protein